MAEPRGRIRPRWAAIVRGGLPRRSICPPTLCVRLWRRLSRLIAGGLRAYGKLRFRGSCRVGVHGCPSWLAAACGDCRLRCWTGGPGLFAPPPDDTRSPGRSVVPPRRADLTPVRSEDSAVAVVDIAQGAAADRGRELFTRAELHAEIAALEAWLSSTPDRIPSRREAR